MSLCSCGGALRKPRKPRKDHIFPHFGPFRVLTRTMGEITRTLGQLLAPFLQFTRALGQAAGRSLGQVGRPGVGHRRSWGRFGALAALLGKPWPPGIVVSTGFRALFCVLGGVHRSFGPFSQVPGCLGIVFSRAMRALCYVPNSDTVNLEMQPNMISQPSMRTQGSSKFCGVCSYRPYF